MVELPACPFCGGELSRCSLWDEEGVEGVCCDDCDAFTACGWDEQPEPAEEWFYPGRAVTHG